MTAIGTSKPCKTGECFGCAYSGELCSCPHHRTLAASPSGRSAGDLGGDTGDVRESLESGKSSAAPGVSTPRRCAWEKCQAGGDILPGAPLTGYIGGALYHRGCAEAKRRAS